MHDPYDPYQWNLNVPPATNTPTFNTPRPEPKYSAKIFYDPDECNEFMEAAVVGDVIIEELEGYPLFIVFYEVEVER